MRFSRVASASGRGEVDHDQAVDAARLDELAHDVLATIGQLDVEDDHVVVRFRKGGLDAADALDSRRSGQEGDDDTDGP